MTSFLREVVSGSNERYRLEGYNLDLTYIDERTIAMGFPATGIEAYYRNGAGIVRDFLAGRHGSSFKVYNLTERDYSPGLFPEGQTVRYPFPDHHAPSLPLLLAILSSMHDWLASDERNVVVCHCLAGHGRTGTVIAALHVFEGKFETPADSLAFFASKRSVSGKGVKYPSQIRSVDEAFMHLCRCRERGLNPFLPLPAPQRRLNSVDLVNIWPRTAPGKYVLILQDADYLIVWTSAWITGKPASFHGNAATWAVGVAVQGNFTIEILQAKKSAKAPKEVVRATLNTDFMPLTPTFELGKFELDGAQSDREHVLFHEHLVMVLRFAES
jgi:hypothetical protein